MQKKIDIGYSFFVGVLSGRNKVTNNLKLRTIQTFDLDPYYFNPEQLADATPGVHLKELEDKLREYEAQIEELRQQLSEKDRIILELQQSESKLQKQLIDCLTGK